VDDVVRQLREMGYRLAQMGSRPKEISVSHFVVGKSRSVLDAVIAKRKRIRIAAHRPGDKSHVQRAHILFPKAGLS